jgi:hypothetical protein
MKLMKSALKYLIQKLKLILQTLGQTTRLKNVRDILSEAPDLKKAYAKNLKEN